MTAIAEVDAIHATFGQEGLYRTADHRYFWRGRGPIPSVTTIQKMLDKSGPLVGWAKRETAACAVRNLPMLVQMRESGGDAAAVAWLKSIPDYQRDTAADIGSRIHGLAERLARGEAVEVTEEERPFAERYAKWIASAEPEFLYLEEMVANLTVGYAGTFDAILRHKGKTYLADVKTGTGIYPETAIQLAAYSRAEFIGRPGDPTKYRIPPIDAYAVIHVRPDQPTEFVPYAVTDASWQAFLACKALHTWSEGEAKRVMGR